MPTYNKDYQRPPTAPAAPVGGATAPQQQPPAPQQNTWQLKGGFDQSGPGAAEDAYGRYSQQLAQPGFTEGYASNPASMNGAQTGTASHAYTSQYNPMDGTSRVDTYAAGNKPLDGKGAAEGYAADQGAFQRAGDASAAGQYWNSVQGKQNAPKDMSGYYDRAREKGSAAIDKAAAARGQFNTSAALDQTTQLNADLGGQQARDEAQYGLQSAELNDKIQSGASQAADTSANQRYGAGLDAAKASDASGMSRYTAGRDTAVSGDTTGISRYNAGLNGAGQADTAGIGRYSAELNAATNADQNAQGRVSQLGQLASGADASRNQRVGGTFDRLGDLTHDVNATAGGAYSDLLNGDQQNFDMQQQLSLGAGLATLGGIKDSNALGAAAANAGAASAAGASQDVQNLLTQLQQKKGGTT